MPRPSPLNRRTSRRTLLTGAVGVGLAVSGFGVILSSCGGGGGSGSGIDGEPTPTPEPDFPPRRGGALRVALTGDPPNLDVHQTTDAIVGLVMYHVYETLFTWDADYRPVPQLAASHEVTDDGLLHTVRLRQGVLFHNGEELAADDVIASIERWGRITPLGMDFLDAVDEIVATDRYTLEYRMKRRFGTFRVALARAIQGCAIYPKSVLDRSSDSDLDEYVGTGPYRFIEYLPDRHLRLERFDDYVGVDADPNGYAGRREANLDRLEFVPVPNEAARIAGLQAGDYDYLENISTDHYISLREDPFVAIDLLPPDNWLNYVINLESSVTSDHDVRRAIQLALDHDAIMQAAFGEDFYELTPTLLPGADAWYTEAGIERFNLNQPDEARNLLAASGYDGQPLRLMTTQEIQLEYNSALVVKQQLEQVGFTIDLRVYDGATLSDRRRAPELWEMYVAWASFRPDPVLRNLTCSATGWWCDEDKDELLRRLQSEHEFEERFAIWEQVQERFYEDVPRLKIGDGRRMLVRSPKLHGISETTSLQPDFSNAWLEE